ALPASWGEFSGPGSRLETLNGCAESPPSLREVEEKAGEEEFPFCGSPLPMNPWEHRTSNIQHPTANQWHWKPLVVRCWMLGVGCVPSVHGFNARNFRGILSPDEAERMDRSDATQGSRV